MILFVRYRNHFSVLQFQNLADIRNPYDPAEVLRPSGVAAGAPIFCIIFFYGHRPEWGAPNITFLLPPPKAAVSRVFYIC